MMCYVGTDGKVRKAIANDADKSTVKLFFALANIGSGASGQLSDGKQITLSGLTPGKPYYLSHTTPGGISVNPPPAVSGNVIRIVGNAISSTLFKIDISTEFSEIP